MKDYYYWCRKQRFERVTKELKVTRVISTLVEEIKAIGSSSGGLEADSKCTDVMAPMALNKRSPVLLLMGGGMGAGKSTVIKDILKEYVPTFHIWIHFPTLPFLSISFFFLRLSLFFFAMSNNVLHLLSI